MLQNITLQETVYIIIAVVLLYKVYKCKCVESFLPTGSHTHTWEEWDDYAKNYGQTRAYWGQMAPGGGWTGSQYSPANNPTGNIPLVGQRPYVPKEVKLVNATDEELTDMYRANLMKPLHGI